MPVRPPSLRSVAAFEAAARHQSFTRAAVELNLTPGAVSHAIKALEARLDRRLFERCGRRVALTPAGRSLVTRIRLSLALLGDAFEAPARARQEILIVSILPSIAHKMLIPALGRLGQKPWCGPLDLRSGIALADVEKEVDVAIRFGPGDWAGVQSRKLSDERLFPVASPSYNGGDLPRGIEDLGGCRLIAHPESSWRLWLEPMGASPADLRPFLALDDSTLVIEAAKAGLGVALARSHLVRDDLRCGRLVRLFDHEVPAEYSYWAVWSGSSRKRDLIERFVDWVQELFAVTDEIPSQEL